MAVVFPPLRSILLPQLPREILQQKRRFFGLSKYARRDVECLLCSVW
jgi:hypothetical protein